MFQQYQELPLTADVPKLSFHFHKQMEERWRTLDDHCSCGEKCIRMYNNEKRVVLDFENWVW